MESQLHVLHSNLPKEIEEETGGTKLKSLVRYFQTLSPVEHRFYDMVMNLSKLIFVMHATNAISEISFSALRSLKTWLRSTINQTRLNWCMILHIHNDDTDKLNIIDVANEFDSRNSTQHIWNIFVIFCLNCSFFFYC